MQSKPLSPVVGLLVFASILAGLCCTLSAAFVSLSMGYWLMALVIICSFQITINNRRFGPSELVSLAMRLAALTAAILLGATAPAILLAIPIVYGLLYKLFWTLR